MIRRREATDVIYLNLGGVIDLMSVNYCGREKETIASGSGIFYGIRFPEAAEHTRLKH